MLAKEFVTGGIW